MLQDLLGTMSDHPGLVVLVVLAAGYLEYVFPPFAGDTLMLCGFFLAGLGEVSPLHVFGAAFLGSCCGAVSAYGIGRTFGHASLSLFSRSKRAKSFLDRAERSYSDHGPSILALNRFVPGVRGFFLPLAGVGRMHVRSVVIWSTLANGVYCSLLLGLGLLGGAFLPGFDDLQAWFRVGSIGIGVLLCGFLAVMTVRFQRERRRCSDAS